MIVELIVTAFTALVTFIGNLMPDLTLPAGVSTAVTTFGSYGS